MDSSSLMQLIKGRRTVYPKNYTGEKVPKRIIEGMLEAASWAPTHKYTEPLRFVVFEGNGLVEFAEIQSERYKKVSLESGHFNEMKFDKLKSRPLLCSHIISIGMHRDNSIPEVEEICSVACSVQNMLLYGASEGVGAYWSTGGVTYDEEMKAYFGLEAKDKLLGFLNIGMADKVLGEGKRTPVGEKVRWVD